MIGLGYQELLIILVIVLLLFGAQKLPELARSLGRSTGEFKKAQAELEKVGTEVTSPHRTPDGKNQT